MFLSGIQKNQSTAFYESSKVSHPLIGKINSIFKSHVFSLLLKVGIITSIAALAYKFSVKISLPYILKPVSLYMVVKVIGFIFLTCEVIRLRKRIMFETSLLYLIIFKRIWWHKITDFIVLGGLPLKHQFEHLRNHLKVSAVLSLVKDFELERGLADPISHAEWIEKGMFTKHIKTADLQPLTTENIEKGVEFLRTQVINKKITYVHCKAGYGRSSSIVIAYILKYGINEIKFQNFDKAYQFVKERRPIWLTESQKQAIINWFKNIFPK